MNPPNELLEHQFLFCGDFAASYRIAIKQQSPGKLPGLYRENNTFFLSGNCQKRIENDRKSKPAWFR
jgi:hypothetical protein